MADSLWTQPITWLLEDMWGEDISAAQIANEIYRQYKVAFTKRAVIGKARRMKLPRRDSINFVAHGSPQPQRMQRPVDTRTVFENRVLFISEELTHKHCRWPVGEFVCGDPVSTHGGSYCDTCAAVAYQCWPPRVGTRKINGY